MNGRLTADKAAADDDHALAQFLLPTIAVPGGHDILAVNAGNGRYGKVRADGGNDGIWGLLLDQIRRCRVLRASLMLSRFST